MGTPDNKNKNCYEVTIYDLFKSINREVKASDKKAIELVNTISSKLSSNFIQRQQQHHLEKKLGINSLTYDMSSKDLLKFLQLYKKEKLKDILVQLELNNTPDSPTAKAGSHIFTLSIDSTNGNIIHDNSDGTTTIRTIEEMKKWLLLYNDLKISLKSSRHKPEDLFNLFKKIAQENNLQDFSLNNLNDSCERSVFAEALNLSKKERSK